MANLSANKLYNLSGVSGQGVKFNDWINAEKDLYDHKIESGKTAGQMSFIDWLNKRWQGKAKYNLIGTAMPIIDMKAAELAQKQKGFGGRLLETAKEIATKSLEKTLDKARGGSATSKTPETGGYVAPERRIFGLKPVVAYSIGAVLAVGAVAGTVYLVKKYRQPQA